MATEEVIVTPMQVVQEYGQRWSVRFRDGTLRPVMFWTICSVCKKPDGWTDGPIPTAGMVVYPMIADPEHPNIGFVPTKELHGATIVPSEPDKPTTKEV